MNAAMSDSPDSTSSKPVIRKVERRRHDLRPRQVKPDGLLRDYVRQLSEAHVAAQVAAERIRASKRAIAMYLGDERKLRGWTVEFMTVMCGVNCVGDYMEIENGVSTPKDGILKNMMRAFGFEPPVLARFFDAPLRAPRPSRRKK